MTRAFEIRVSITAADIKETKFAEDVRGAIARHRESPQFIREPGISATGPCIRCAQYFYMTHDGSGRVVPKIPVHVHGCVCRDTPLAVYELRNDAQPIRGMRQWEWATETGRGQDVVNRAVGPTRAHLLKNNVIAAEDLVEAHGAAPGLVPMQTLARRIAASPARRAALAEVLAGLKISVSEQTSVMQRLRTLEARLRRQ